MIATVSTSVRKDELDLIDELVTELEQEWPGVTRTGVIRAMVRHSLDDVGDFKQWLREESPGIDRTGAIPAVPHPLDDPDRTLGTDVTDTTSTTTNEEK